MANFYPPPRNQNCNAPRSAFAINQTCESRDRKCPTMTLRLGSPHGRREHHSSLAIAANVYSHVTTDLAKDSAEMVAGALAANAM